MRILLSAFHCSPLHGSELATGWNWALELSNLGHQLTVITQSEMREYINSVEPLRNVEFQYVDLPDLRLRRISNYLAIIRAYTRWQDDALAFISGRDGEFDVAHHVTWGGLHLGSGLWQLSTPLIFGPVGSGQIPPSRYRRYFGREWQNEMLRGVVSGPLLNANKFARRTVRNAAMTLVYSSDTLAACKRLGARDVRFMMADGLATNRIGAPRLQPSGVPVILYVGRLLARKGPTLAVQAFAELRRNMPARLVIAGDGPLRDEVEAHALRLGVTSDVEVLGSVPFAEVGKLYDEASVLLFPSLRESFGSPVLEAAGRGLPVVALNRSGIAEADTRTAVEKVSLPADPRDLPGRLASALGTVLTDGNWHARSIDGIRFASTWSWPAKAATATELYQEVAG